MCLSLHQLTLELWKSRVMSEQRCLMQACECIEDLIYALPEEGEDKIIQKVEKELNFSKYNSKYEHAKACFELHEYDRAAYFLKNSTEPISRFLHFFSLYKAAEKKRIDIMGEVTNNLPPRAVKKFTDLRDSLERSMKEQEPDGWLLYVYGLVLYKFRLEEEAIKVFEKAINISYRNWSAWHMLTLTVRDKAQLSKLNLPNHPFKIFFYFMMRLEFNVGVGSAWSSPPIRDARGSTKKYFDESLFVKSLLAKSLGYGSQSGNSEKGIELFKQIRQADPYRLDGLEIYSNMLFVSGKKTELSRLAYEVEKIDPFTAETNCCIANSYSARSQHDKAIVYFLRSLRLNPDHYTSWTLIGHEYLEVKNIDKAVQVYRASISINKRDCRAWLGLGNAFETIMSNPSVTNPDFEACLYYYSQVRKYRPNDHVMWQAMSNVYKKMDRPQETTVCTHRAKD